jgi:hypothetical protein
LYEDATDICEMKSVIRLKHGLRAIERGGGWLTKHSFLASDPGRWRGWLDDEGADEGWALVGVEVSSAVTFNNPYQFGPDNYPSTTSKDSFRLPKGHLQTKVPSPKHQAKESTTEAMPASQLQGLLSDLTEDFQATQQTGDVLQFCADWFQARLKAEVSSFVGCVSSGFVKVDGQSVECGGFPFWDRSRC